MCLKEIVKYNVKPKAIRENLLTHAYGVNLLKSAVYPWEIASGMTGVSAAVTG